MSNKMVGDRSRSITECKDVGRRFGQVIDFMLRDGRGLSVVGEVPNGIVLEIADLADCGAQRSMAVVVGI